MAVYHVVELLGHLPAVLLIIIACYIYRDRLFLLLKSERWIWTYVLIFGFLFVPFLSLSEKPEYMLPALPGLFMILGRCLPDNWWKAITVAFVFNAFVSFGFGHAPTTGGLRLETAGPELRPGVLLYYAGRAKAMNDFISHIESELSNPPEIIRVVPAMDTFYVSSLLKRGSESQALISCPLLPVLLSFSDGKQLEISLTNSTATTRPSHYSAVVCCRSMSALVPAAVPTSWDGELLGAVRRFCMRDAGTTTRP